MTFFNKPTFLAALMIPGLALAQINVGATLGTSEDAIRTALEADGYMIKEVEFDSDEIEVEAMRDGTLYEFEVAADTGQIIAVELDDETNDS